LGGLSVGGQRKGVICNKLVHKVVLRREEAVVFPPTNRCVAKGYSQLLLRFMRLKSERGEVSVTITGGRMVGGDWNPRREFQWGVLAVLL